MNETRSDRGYVDSHVYCASVPALDAIIINLAGRRLFELVIQETRVILVAGSLQQINRGMKDYEVLGNVYRC